MVHDERIDFKGAVKVEKFLVRACQDFTLDRNHYRVSKLFGCPYSDAIPFVSAVGTCLLKVVHRLSAPVVQNLDDVGIACLVWLAAARGE